MKSPVTIIAPIKLANGKTEADLISASDHFQSEFVSHQPGVIRRELVRTGEGEYVDIIQFRSVEDAHEVMEKEKESTVCAEFFAVMDMTDVDESAMKLLPSLATYT